MGHGKGVATFYKTELINQMYDIKKAKAQITLLSLPEVDIINVYRSEGMNNNELAEDLGNLINISKLTIVYGDFNLCFVDNRQNSVTQMLENIGFTQLVQEASHYHGGHIDHVYTNHNSERYHVDVSLYCPFYLARDHSAVLITITNAEKKLPQSYGKYTMRKTPR